uniref:GINS subunit domain-containing protein n=1 Tax=Aegilops tauschii subsp. strangulata TaxID=200361 RepID=A0A453FQ69_AEGTS
MRVRCPYFYELGCKIVPLVGDKSIGQFLRYAFTSRYKEILSKAHSSSTMTVPKFATRLTKEEAQECLNLLGSRCPPSGSGASGVRGCRRRPFLEGRGRQSCLTGLRRPELFLLWSAVPGRERANVCTLIDLVL